MENKELNNNINIENNVKNIDTENTENTENTTDSVDIKEVHKKKIFKSASLTFYSKELGYLLCEEFRYKEKKILIHPIGGKVENYDKDIFSTAVREFIEEVNLEQHTIINSEKNIKSKLVDNMCEKLENISYYIDLCINKEKKYFHRYFLVLIDNINDIKFKKNIIELPNYFNGNCKTEINKINWYLISKKKNVIIGNTSWLTKMFVKFLIKKNI
jgi:hypothetical protein